MNTISPPSLSLSLSHSHSPLLFPPPPPPAFSSPLKIPPPPTPPICQPLFGFSSSMTTTPQSYLSDNSQLFPAAPPYAFNPTNNSVLLSKDNEAAGRRVLDAWSTKVARSKRRLARQRTLTLNRASSSSSSSSSPSSFSGFGYGGGAEEYSSKGLTVTTTAVSSTNNADSLNNRTHNLFTFCTPDKKILRLKMLLKKELKNSDVGSLGRIVLPKREAEENLPLLTDKEGMQIVIRDMNSHRKWAMKYKYWANNRSRMYVLENTGDFVRQNGLVIGDAMTLYEDEFKNLYVSIQKGEKHSSMEEKQNFLHGEESSAKTYTNHNNMIMTIKDEEEEASLALLIEDLKPPPNLTLSHNSDNSGCTTAAFDRGCYITRRPSTAARAKGKEEESDHFQSMNNYNNYNYNNNGFEDCFGGLDPLPEVGGFNCSLFDYFSNDRT